MGLTLSVLRAQRIGKDLCLGRLEPQEIERVLERRPELLRMRALAAQQTVLHVAAAAANIDLVRCILRCAEALPEAPPSCEGVPFGQSAHGGAGTLAVVNLRNARGQTPLMLAAGNPGGEACVRALLDAGADPFAADMCGGRTAVFYAAARDAADCAAALLDATLGVPMPRPTFPNGAGTGLADVRMLAGFSALHVAVAADARDTVRVLLRATKRLGVPTLFGSYDFIACARGTTPLHLAARLGRVVIAKTILLAHATAPAGSRGIDPRALLDDLHRLPCHIAAINGHDQLAALLQPGAPLAQVLAEDEGLYLWGPPPLRLLASAALRARQQATLASARRALGLGAGGGLGCKEHAAAALARCKLLAEAPGTGSATGGPSCGVHHVHSATAVDPAATGTDEPQPLKDVGFVMRSLAQPACSASGTPTSAVAAPARHPAAAVGEHDAGGSGGSWAGGAGLGTGGSFDDRDGCCGACTFVGEDTEAECCGICFDELPVIRVQPCGHTLCCACCDSLLSTSGTDIVVCPFCRGAVGMFAPACC